MAQESITSYRELVVWQKAMDLVEQVYQATGAWPREEIYGLTSQIRRAAVSIPSNIAESQGRGSTAEFLRGLRISYGSLLEVETQILLAQRLGFLPPERKDQLLAKTAEVGRLINGLSRSLTRKSQPNN